MRWKTAAALILIFCLSVPFPCATGQTGPSEKSAAPESPPREATGAPQPDSRDSRGAEIDDIDADLLAQLVKVRRIYVEQLGGGSAAGQIRDMIIAGLQGSRLFILTEELKRADAILKGSAEDLVYTEQFSSSDSLSARTGLSLPGDSGKSSSRTSVSLGVNEDDAIRKTERKHEAVASVRLVSRDGDVLWSTTQESNGAKFKGSSADVAEKITKRLTEAYTRAKRVTNVRK